LRRFLLIRLVDETGVSGQGIVAEGCELIGGKAVLSWLTPTSSVAIYSSVEDLNTIHGHDGKTTVKWLDADGEDQSLIGYYKARMDRLGF
jgi:hypothetical protein